MEQPQGGLEPTIHHGEALNAELAPEIKPVSCQRDGCHYWRSHVERRVG